MRFARVDHPAHRGFAVVEQDGGSQWWRPVAGDALSGGLAAAAGLHPAGVRWPLAEARLLAPVVPSKVVVIGLNYPDHAAELGTTGPGQPRVFFKAASSVVGPGDRIVCPAESSRVDFEAELAVVIGRRCRSVSAAEALESVWGFTCANDVTARDIQRERGLVSYAKSFDTFGPLGPWVETDLDLAAGVRVSCRVNGEVRQDGSTRDLLWNVPRLIEYVSAAMTLLPGDVLLTGTPAGVGPLKSGDEVSVTVEGIGTLANPVE